MGSKSRLLLASFLGVVCICYAVSGIQLLRAGRTDSAVQPLASPIPRLTQRVVVVVLDGVPTRVGYDKDIMPFVVASARAGASGVLRAPEQTTTPAGVRALATGQATNAADLLNMFSESEYKGWTVFDDVIGRGETVSLGGDKEWTSLLASRDPEGIRGTDTETRLYQNALQALDHAASRLHSAHPPALTVVHLGETDRLGHLYGTASAAYKTRMKAIDSAIRAFAANAIGPNATLIITADHGNDVFGSHGGEADVYRNVPIVMLGPGIRSGAHIEMDARALPGVLAVLLGTRIPPEMQAVVPGDAFDITDAQRQNLIDVNAAQLRRLMATRGLAELPHATPVDRTILSSMAEALDTTAPISVPRILWAAVLFASLFVVAIELFRSPGNLTAATRISLAVVATILVISLALPGAIVPLLSLTAAIELAVLAANLIRIRRFVPLLAVVLCIAIPGMAAVRFAFMSRIKAALVANPYLPLAVAVIAGVSGLVAWARRRSIGFTPEDSGLAVGLALLLVAMIAPFASAPSMLLAVSVIGLWAAGASWREIALTSAALTMFFFIGERSAFSRVGEGLPARYAFVAVSCGVVAVLLFFRGGVQRKWLMLAWIFLSPLWPFGYLRVGGPSISPTIITILVMISLTLASVAATRFIRLWWPYATVAATAIYHLAPSHELFWVAIAVHSAVVGAVIALSVPGKVASAIIGLTALSGLILTSQHSAAPSLLLIALGLAAVAQMDFRPLPPAAAMFLGAAVLVFARYSLVAVFSHGPNLDCTLKCVDEASGFLGFDETRWTRAIGLIALKMLFATVLVLAVLALNSQLRRSEGDITLAGLLLVFGFISKAGLEAALSFGTRGSSLGLALGQVGFGVLVWLAVGLGFLLYAAIARDRVPEEAVAPELSRAVA